MCRSAGCIPQGVFFLILGIQERSKIVINKEKFLFTRKEVKFSGFCEVKMSKMIMDRLGEGTLSMKMDNLVVVTESVDTVVSRG